jgi:urease accessory protein
MTVARIAALTGGLLLIAGAAMAHEGDLTGGGFMTGFDHPFLGWDHLAAMVAVGLWGGSLGRPAIWMLPVGFPLVMVLGFWLAAARVGFPAVESGIAASALVLGLVVAFAARPPLAVAGALVGCFALFHGHAHGAEMPAAASPLLYAAGFAVGTALLHMVGVATGLLAQWSGGGVAVRACGALVALAGLGFIGAAA